MIWSPSGKAGVCYRVVSGVMLASGDPLGDPEAWPGAITEFLADAARHAWRPAVMGCSELGAEVWCREGDLTALELGDEAIVNVAEFSLAGRQMRNVRQMVNRVAKNGYAAEVRRIGDIPRPELDAIIREADLWRGTQVERGFSMALGRLGAPGDENCVLVTAEENGVLKAVLHFVPWGHDGLSLDLMRRDRNAQAGLNDFLIVESIKAAPELGIKRLSLNFAMFRAALERGEKIGAGPVLKAWRGLLVFLSRWFQIESLYKFNAKFSPVWEPRFFVFPGGRDAPRIAFAALEAEAFLVWPTLSLRRHARRAARALGLGSGLASLGGTTPRTPRCSRGRAAQTNPARGDDPAKPPRDTALGDVVAAAPVHGRGLANIPVMVNLPGLAGAPQAGRCLVMGVVNVTPDSFSDGGQWFGATAAVEHGLELVAQGADIVDVGGESTRPGAQRVAADEELRRVRPVVTELVAAGAVVSIDTMRARVAEWALDAGVSLVNDVSGGLADPYMPRLVAKAGVPYVVMHWRGHSHDMERRAVYADVVREVHDELAQRIDAVTAEGVDPSLIVLDPGLGFSKNPAASGPDAHNWQLLAGLGELASIEGHTFPVLVSGASRQAATLSRYWSYPLGGTALRHGGPPPPIPPGPRTPRCPCGQPLIAKTRERIGLRPHGRDCRAALLGQRRGDGRHHCDFRGGRRLVRPGPPRPRERGRGPGGRCLPRGAAVMRGRRS